MSLSGKVALITGAASGIGQAAARALSRKGAAIAAVDRNADALAALVAELEQAGGRAVAIPTDVSQSDQVTAMVAETARQLGSIDILVHSAAVHAARAPVLEISDETWRRSLSVNLDGTFYVGREVGKVMSAQGAGTMVFMTSDRGLYGGPNVGDYAAAKGAMLAFTKTLAVELAPRGVTVNSVNPGTTDTPMLRDGAGSASRIEDRKKKDPLGRLSEPEEIADIILFLAERAGQFMTGQLITTRMRVG